MTDALVVHRRPAVRRFVALGLRFAGFEVVEAEDLAIAGRLLQTRPVELLVTEASIAGGDAQQLMHLAHELRPGIPVVVVSAYGRPPRGMEDAFLAEPFDVDQLLATVTPLIRPAAPAPAWPPTRDEHNPRAAAPTPRHDIVRANSAR
jgi:DNA-binding NtrC family response regulator